MGRSRAVRASDLVSSRHAQFGNKEVKQLTNLVAFACKFDISTGGTHIGKQPDRSCQHATGDGHGYVAFIADIGHGVGPA